MKNIVVIGSTGVGKSSLLNTLCGSKENEFYVSASGQSVTNETTSKIFKWRNSENKVRLVDTPGLADSKGKDSIHIA
jgi:small GTP-binding protein